MSIDDDDLDVLNPNQPANDNGRDPNLRALDARLLGHLLELLDDKRPYGLHKTLIFAALEHREPTATPRDIKGALCAAEVSGFIVDNSGRLSLSRFITSQQVKFLLALARSTPK